MLLTFKIQLRLTGEQQSIIDSLSNDGRMLYNHYLGKLKEQYDIDKKFISYYTQQKELKDYKSEYLTFDVKKEILRTLHSNYSSFFKLVKQNKDLNPKPPKFRGKDVKCLPLYLIPGWLFSINTNKVSPEVKPILLAYKKDVYRVLFDHYYGKTKMVLSNLRRNHELEQQRKVINAQIAILMKEHKTIEKEQKELMKNNFCQLELEFPEHAEVAEITNK